MNVRTILWGVIALLVAGMAIFAQTNSGMLSGTITTLSGAPVANATVALTDTATNQSKRVLTGKDGKFVISGMPPGKYMLIVEVAGFKRIAQNVVIPTPANSPTNIRLEAGSKVDTVQLTGRAPTTQTQNGEIAAAIDMRQIDDLPVIDRNNGQLTELQTGITPPLPLDFIVHPERNRFFSSTGQSPLFNMFNVDSTMNWEPNQGTEIRVQPNEVMQQKDIVTSNYLENQGYAGGAVIHDLTRAGTNDWHGDLFEFWSGNSMQTRSSFDSLNSGPPRFVYNQMGAAIGGPIAKDKTFIFGSYEGTFINGFTRDLTTVPTPAILTGNFSSIPGLTLFQPNTGIGGMFRTPYVGNVIPSGDLNPAAVSIASALPSPNLPGLVNNYLATDPERNHNNKADGRIDQRFGDRTSAFLRFGFSNDYALGGSPLGDVVGSAITNRLLAYNSAIDLTHQFSPRLIADVRFSYNRYDANLAALNSEWQLSTQPGFFNGFTGGLASIEIPGLAPIGAPAYLPENGIDNTFQWATNWNRVSSNHDIKWGVDIRRIRSDGFTQTPFNTQFGPNGTFLFGPGATLTSEIPGLSQNGELYNSLAAFLTGSPSQYGISNYLTTPTIRQTEYAAWIGDTLHPFHHLTITVGLRYEVYSPLEPRTAGGAQFFNPADNTFNYANVGFHNGLNTYDLDNFAPRFGYAYQFNDKTTIRGGYGISYFQTPYLYTGFQPTVFGSVTGVAGGYTVAPQVTPFDGTLTNTAPLPTLTGPNPAGNLPATVVGRNLSTPYVQSYSTEIQREFYWGTVLSAGYVGSVGRKLPYIEELNASFPGTGIAGLPFLPLGRTESTLFFDNGISDNYNSLQAKLIRRFSKGLSFTGAYTLSKALGYTTSNLFLLNPFNFQSNYGPQPWDRQNVLTLAQLWELPFLKDGKTLKATLLGGWQVNSIFNWGQGTPLAVTADPITCQCINYTPFANFVGNGVSPYASGPNTVLNPAAFTAAPLGDLGNVNRGAVRGPSVTRFDLSLFKNFRVREKYNFQLRGEAYNLLNSKQFLNPVSNISAPDFGLVNGTFPAGFSRQVTVALVVSF